MNQKPDPKDLFARAHRLGIKAREAFLNEACKGDAELHLEVQRMLVDSEKADAFFSDDDGDTLGAGAFDATYAEKEGDQIGPYKLRQQIGEGGFGTVWMAEQKEPISRMVALKVIKAGMDTKQVLARFEAERQAVAMMDHPNIAKVLDAGATATGRPYFAMELVKGIPITDYCDQAALDTKERLALFGDVCSAINHAHQKGIIHRDIKPSNVMVTVHGDKLVVKVIDFGIAKATQGKLTDQTLFTRFEQFIGTPVYMSPEQASMSGLDIDTRSDIYALGILLYELLVGKPPFDGKSLVSAGYEEMRRIIREVEPVKPSSRLGTIAGEERTLLAKARHIEEGKLNKLVEPDLDWIVMKAIEKDRGRRYETANAFAQDIVRFLGDEAVTARPPSKGYQFRKFARRNKAAFRIAALIALLLVAATLVSGWQAVRATKAEALATDRLVESEKARADAEAISGFLTGMFESSRPGEEKGGREVKVADVLDIAAKKLETELADQPERRAKLQATLGSTYHALGLYREAIPLFEDARHNLARRLGVRHPATLSAMHHHASALYNAGQRDEPLKLSEEVLDLRREVLGSEHPDTLATQHDLAFIYHKMGRTREGIPLLEEVLRLRRKVLGPEHPDTLTTMHYLADLYQRSTGRGTAHTEEQIRLRNKAFELFAQALALRRKVLGPEHPDTLSTMHYLALSHWLFPSPDIRPTGAGVTRQLLEELVPLREKVLGPDHPDTLWSKFYLAALYSYDSSRSEEVIRMREEIVAGRRKSLEPDASELQLAIGMLANCYKKAGRMEEAAKLRAEAETIKEKRAAAEAEAFWGEHAGDSRVAELTEAGMKLFRGPGGTWRMEVIRNEDFSDLTILREARISDLNVGGTAVADLAPLHGMPLRRLCFWNTKVDDLTPLRGMKLEVLQMSGTQVTDLSPLRGMPLTELKMHECKELTDISPLADCKELIDLTLPPNAKDFEFLRDFPKLERISFSIDRNKGHCPDKTVEEFWKEYDAKTQKDDPE